EVPQKRACTAERSQVREVHGGRGLSDAAFDVVGREYLAHANVSVIAARRRLSAKDAKRCANSIRASACWAVSRSTRTPIAISAGAPFSRVAVSSAREQSIPA